jgi:hypothetical protein
MRNPRLALCLFFALSSFTLAVSEVAVVITAPTLTTGGVLQAMLDEEVASYTKNIQSIVNEALTKPLLMQSLADANTENSLLTGFVYLNDRRYVSIVVGGCASLVSDTHDIPSLESRLENFQLSSDYSLGAAAQPLCLQLDVSLARLVKGLGAQASFGYIPPLEYQGFEFSSISAQCGLDWLCLGPVGNKRLVRWDGLEFGLGLAWSYNSLNTRISTGESSRTLSFRPDGDGPLLPITVTISLDPQFDATVEMQSFALPFQVTTGFTVLGAFSFQIGGGLYPAFGWSDIRLQSVDGTTKISVDNYLESLISQDGYITASGTTDPVYSKVFGYFASGALRLLMGRCSITLPVIWDYSTGLSAGLNVGVSI